MLLPLAAGAQVPPGSYFPESAEEKPWEEQKTQIPPFPEEASLLKFSVDGVTSFDFFIDLASVSVGSDGVIRYALLARSESGARNLNFEGIKCKGRERKIYAFGRTDGTWSQARDPKWVPISGDRANRHYATLADEYFCPGQMIVGNTAEATNALRNGGHPRASNDDVLRNRPQ